MIDPCLKKKEVSKIMFFFVSKRPLKHRYFNFHSVYFLIKLVSYKFIACVGVRSSARLSFHQHFGITSKTLLKNSTKLSSCH